MDSDVGNGQLIPESVKKPPVNAIVVILVATLLQILSQSAPASAIDYPLTDAQVKEAVALGKEFPWPHWSTWNPSEWTLGKLDSPTIKLETPFYSLMSFTSFAPMLGVSVSGMPRHSESGIAQILKQTIGQTQKQGHFDIQVDLFSFRNPHDNAHVYMTLIQDGRKIRATMGGSGDNNTHNDILHGQPFVWYQRLGEWYFDFKDFDCKRPFTIRLKNYIFGSVPGNVDYVIDPSKIR